MNDRAGMCRLVAAGDAAVTVEFENRIDPEVNARAVALADALTRVPVAGVRDIVPTYRSVTVFFDPLKTDYTALTRHLEQAAARAVDAPAEARAPIRIPVRYGGAGGPDLSSVAAFAGLTEREVAAIHASAVYRVFMLGFVPGFAYMGQVDPRIAMPRRPTPRLRVASGSVGIAGAQTGIYPRESPGGWQIIGQTLTRLLDEAGETPIFKAGDMVRFTDIDQEAC